MSAPDRDFHAGVLVVHGIGTQAKESSLRDFVDPVVGLLDRLGDDGARAQLRRPPKEGFVVIETPPITRKRDADGDAVAGEKRVESQCWLAGEAWWAEAFDAPSRAEVSRWLVDAGPWFAFFFVARLWRRFGVRRWHLAAGLAGAGAATFVAYSAVTGELSWLRWATFGLALVLIGSIALLSPPGAKTAAAIVALTVVLVYPLAALASVGIVVIYVVGLLPGGWSKKVRAFQLTLARSVGDTFALVSSARRERAMFDAIIEGASALCEQLDGSTKDAAKRPLVITAHSQGAALLYRLLNRLEPEVVELLAGREVTLVTHGAAILPVSVLESRHVAPGRGALSLRGLGGLLGLLLLAFSLGRAVGTTIDPVVLGTAMTSLVLVLDAFRRAMTDERKSVCSDPVEELHEPWSEKDEGIPVDGGDETASTVDEGDETASTVVSPASAGHTRPKPSELESKRWWKGLSHPKEIAGATASHGKSAVCPELRVPPTTELRWVDMWAPWDPVPNGPLDFRYPYPSGGPYEPLPGPQTGFLPVQVANDQQPWVDHVIYRTNDEDVVIRWIGEIARLGGGRATNGSRVVEPFHVEPVVADNAVPPVVRASRLRIGRWIFVLQVLLLTAGVSATLARWEALNDLGRWATRRFPGPLRTVTATTIDVIPESAREAVFGGERDTSHMQGLLVAAAGLAGALIVLSFVAGAWRRASSRRMPRGPTRRTSWMWLWGAATVVTWLAGLVACGWIGTEESQDSGVVYEIRLGEAGGGHDRPLTTVTFLPVGASEDDAIEVTANSGDEPTSVTLDASRTYVVTATAVGAEKCEASVDSGDHTVVVTCELDGDLISWD